MTKKGCRVRIFALSAGAAKASRRRCHDPGWQKSFRGNLIQVDSGGANGLGIIEDLFAHCLCGDGLGSNGSAVGEHQRILSQKVTLLCIQGLIGLPFGESIVAWNLLDLIEDEARLSALL